MKKVLKKTYNKLLSTKYLGQLENIQKQSLFQLQKNKKELMEHSFLAKDRSVINVTVEFKNKFFKIKYLNNYKEIQERHPVYTISKKIYK